MKAAINPPEEFEIRVDYDETPAGKLLRNILSDIFPNLNFELIVKVPDTSNYSENYISIFLDTVQVESEDE